MDILRRERGSLVTTQIAVAEADYLILDRLGPDVELAFLRDLAAGTFRAECLSSAEVGEAIEIAARYSDLRPGLADMSLVLLARRQNTRRIATLDERAFRTITPLQGGTFTILPADR